MRVRPVTHNQAFHAGLDGMGGSHLLNERGYTFLRAKPRHQHRQEVTAGYAKFSPNRLAVAHWRIIGHAAWDHAYRVTAVAVADQSARPDWL